MRYIFLLTLLFSCSIPHDFKEGDYVLIDNKYHGIVLKPNEWAYGNNKYVLVDWFDSKGEFQVEWIDYRFIKKDTIK